MLLALGVGFMAAAIAVGGFLARARSVLRGDDDQAVRRATVIGGLFGLGGALLIIILDGIAG